MLKRTPLFTVHQALGGKLIEFGGWEMPVQYSGIIDEHQAVRKAAGMFDISHMGEIMVSGPRAGEFLNRLLTNDIRKLHPGLGQYTLMCNERGGVIDDLYVYQLGAEEFLLIVNASRIAPDFDWITAAHGSSPFAKDVRVRNESEQTGALALQGPAVATFVDKVVLGGAKAGKQVTRCTELKKNEIARFEISGAAVWVSRTGYTGEDGFEMVTQAGSIADVWNQLLETGRPHGLKPAGLGARDTLRTEVCYPLYGHELDENTTPIEAGLSFFVALEKPEFTGRNTLAEQKGSGPARKLVAFRSVERSAPPRPGYSIWSGGDSGEDLGIVTSGTQGPSLGVGIGLGYVRSDFAQPETRVFVEARGRRNPALITRKPLYRKPH